MTTPEQNPLDSLLKNLKDLIGDIETTTREATGHASERMRSVQDQITAQIGPRLDQILDSAKTVAQDAKTVAQDSAKVADDTVRENPWKAVGVAAVVGILLGSMVKRK